MSRQQLVQHGDGRREPEPVRLHSGDGVGQRVWLSAREAAFYVGCKSVKGFYEWRKRHGLVPNGRGQFARRDLDKARAIPRKRHVMAPASLANLQRRHRSESGRSAVPGPLNQVQ